LFDGPDLGRQTEALKRTGHISPSHFQSRAKRNTSCCVVFAMALLSFADSSPRAQRLKVGNACPPISTFTGAFPGAARRARALGLRASRSRRAAIRKPPRLMPTLLRQIGGTAFSKIDLGSTTGSLRTTEFIALLVPGTERLSACRPLDGACPIPRGLDFDGFR
jgi:hypothetical protein